MRFRKIMRRTIIYSFSLLFLWLMLAQCFLMRNRWSDNKAYRVFKSKQVPLTIYDTIIDQRHLHYAVCGNGDSLPTLVFIHGSPGSWMNYMKFMWDSAIRKKSGRDVDLTVIPCGNYTHTSKYVLPVKPSPNLPDMASIYLYPSTCFFEGTVLSEGRATERPFQMFGHPKLPDSLFSFTPRPREGAMNTKLLNQLCYGWDLGGSNEEVLKKVDGKLQFRWMKEAYNLFPGKDTFFLYKGKNFDRLAGNDVLRNQIVKGLTDEEIRNSWKPELDKFKVIRKKYLLYKDFE